MNAHPAAEIFPMLPRDQLESLADDIKENGLLHPIVTLNGLILDGRNRYKACQLVGVKPMIVEWNNPEGNPWKYVISANAKRRQLNEGQLAMIVLGAEGDITAWEDAHIETARRANEARAVAARARPRAADGTLTSGASREAALATEPKPEPVGKTAARLADVAGVSRATMERTRAVAKSPELAGRVKEGKLSLSAAYKQLKAEEKKEELRVAQSAVADSDIDEVADIRHCKMEDLLSSASDIDAIITDPPYPKEFLPLYEELARLSAKALRPGGILAVMCGQSYLPEIIASMSKHIPYRWMFAYVTPGGQAVQLWDRKINTFWKPIIVFGGSEAWSGDVVKSDVNDNDKRFHKWGQTESGMRYLVDSLSKPGDLICDPFVGGGTTAVVAVANGRKFIGCDIDESHVKTSKSRIAEVLNVLRK